MLTLKIGISRSNFISSRSEDFRVFFYVIWWTEYEKNTEKNLWGILDLENLQSRSNFIFCISESWRRLCSVIDALKMAKTVKQNPHTIFDFEIEIFNIKAVCSNSFTIFYVFSASNYIQNTLSNLHDKWDKFFALHFTLPAGLVDASTSSQVGDSTWDIHWFYA